MTYAHPAMSGMLPLRDTDPREVGGYRLLGRLGEGGQGVVFLALGPTESRAAVKLLAPTTDPLVRSRFLKEVAAAQRVAGFCTARVLDAGIFERRPYIVSEYVSGPSLVEVVQQHGPRTGAVLERVAVATLTALGAVHAVGMVHRDFKPGNVLLGPDGPVVIDFGLAAVPGMTTGLSGQVAVGTPAFMAPEQLAAVRVTAAADMWSWAVTIAFTGTGELPFKGESLTATAYAILHSEPTVGPLPEPLGSLVYRCLSKDPATRPSARGALRELAAAGARLAGPLPPVAPALPPVAPASPPVTAASPLTVPPLAADERPRVSSGAPTEAPEPRPGGDDGLIGVRPAATQRPARPGGGRARRGWQVAAVLTSLLLVAGATGGAFLFARRGASPERLMDSRGGTSQQLHAAAEARTNAIDWIVHQVSRSAIVGCDPQVCTDLTGAGFPGGNLLPLGPQSNDPLGSALVVATSAIRAHFGPRLAVWAPAVLASFGSGNARIDVRLVFHGGAKSYRGVQRRALRARKAADVQLLTNRHITFSATARTQLLSGDIDPRLPLLLVMMAFRHPVYVVDFYGWSPGGGPASLLRWVDLAPVDTAAHLTRAAYLSWVQDFIGAQRAQYRPQIQQTTPRGGQAVLRIGYGAPSPLSASGSS